MSKTLVAYFSASGVTKRVAENLAKATDGALYEIRPEIPYTNADLNWMDKKSRSTIEMKDKSSRPKLADHEADIESYDRIFLGFPIWWYEAPRIIHTFLESYDWTGKTLIPFNTSASGGFGRSLSGIEESAAGAEVLEGLDLTESELPDAESRISEWLTGLGLTL